MILVILFIGCITLSGQVITKEHEGWTEKADFLHFRNAMEKELYSKEDLYRNIEGSPFLNNNFADGVLITNDSIMYENVPLRYNIFKDEMEFLITPDDGPRIIGNPRNFLYFILDDRLFAYKAFMEKDRPVYKYFEIVRTGKCQVLKRKNVVYVEPQQSRGIVGSSPAKFEERRDSYYLQFGTLSPVEVNLRRRSILDAFDQKRDEIAAFVNDNNLSYRNPDDLIKMAEYYNRLYED